MPDRLIDLFIRLCLQSNGALSARKRVARFDFITDEELSAMEQAVGERYKLAGSSKEASKAIPEA